MLPRHAPGHLTGWVFFPAASTASTTGRYPVHRQMFPPKYAFTSSRDGCGFSDSSAFAVRIIPDVQNPHWPPPPR